MSDKLTEFSNKLEMFKKGFEVIAGNIETQLKKVNAEVDKLVQNTDPIPKIKNDNKDLFRQLSGLSALLGELTRRLDNISSY